MSKPSCQSHASMQTPRAIPTLEPLEPRVLFSATYDALESPATPPPVELPDNTVYADADLEWGRFDIGGGGHVDQLIVHPTVSGLMYARSDVGGVYRKDPGADRWHQLLDQFPDVDIDAFDFEDNLMGADAIAVSAQSPDVIFAALGRNTDNNRPSGLYRSTDRGNSWTRVLNVEVGANMDLRERSSSIAVDPINGDYVYFGTRENGLYKSNDGGLNWTQVSTSTIPVGIPTDDPATDPNGRGRDIGIRNVIIDTNTSIGSGSTQRAQRIFVNPRNEGIYRSNDGGSTWAKLTGSNAPDTVESWAFDDTGRYLFISAEYKDPSDQYETQDQEKVLVYDTQTNTFSDITPTAAKISNYSGAIPSAWGGIGYESGTDTLFLNWRGSDFHTLTSTDRGVTWRYYDWDNSSHVNITQEAWRADLWVRQNSYGFVDDPHNSGVIYRSDIFNVWRIEIDSPTNFDLISDAVGLENTEPLALAASPSASELIHAGMQDVSGFTYESLSQDAQQRFTELRTTSSQFDSDTTSVAVSQNNPDHLIISTEFDKAAVSTNGGQSFVQVTPNTATSNDRSNVAIDANNPDKLYYIGSASGGTRYLRYSGNGGSSWSNGTGLPNLWMQGDKFGNAQVLAASANKSNRAYVYVPTAFNSGSGGRMYRTDNAGVTWSQRAALPSSQAKFGVQVKGVTGKADDVWVGLERQGLWRSTNGGNSFTEVGGFNNVIAFGFGKAKPGTSNPAVYAYGKRGSNWGVFESTDYGSTWTELNDNRWPALARVVQIEGDPNEYGKLYIGFGGQGLGWIDIDPDAPGAFQQSTNQNGIVSIDAESYTGVAGGTTDSWTRKAGGAGGFHMEAGLDDGNSYNSDYVVNSPRLDYRIDFNKTGTHYVWIRGKAGGSTKGTSDSVHVGLNGQAVTTADRISGFDTGFVWESDTMDGARATIDIPATGTYTLNVWMREDGFDFDKLLLTTLSTYTPSNNGPAQSPFENGGGAVAAIDFTGASFSPYSGTQDGGNGQPTGLSVEQGGNAVRITGNAWKKTAFDYNVTANTYLSFDFEATSMGELFGIALEKDNNYNRGGSRVIYLGGTDGPPSAFQQIPGLTLYTNPSQGTLTYTVHIGSFYTGDIDWLTFVADDDLQGNANVLFSNIRVFEA